MLNMYSVEAVPVAAPREAAVEHSAAANGDEAMTDAASPSDKDAATQDASKKDELTMDTTDDDHKKRAGDDDDEERRAAAPAVVDDIEQQAAKKRRLAVAADESKKRGKRMFGLLQNTLQQARKDTGTLAEKNKRRNELEKRLQDKLASERLEMEKKREREQETKSLRLDVVRKEEELGKAEAIYEVRHSVKLNLAHFLCTAFPVPPPQQATDDIKEAYMPRLPHAQRSAHPNAPRPIYYLPYKLLRWQEDRIDDQIDDVKKAIRKDKEAWEDSRTDKIGDLQIAKKKRAERLQEVTREERRERDDRGDSRNDEMAIRGRGGRARGADDEAGGRRTVGRDRDGDEDMRDRSRSRSPRRERSRSRSRSMSRSTSRSRPPAAAAAAPAIKDGTDAQDVKMQDDSDRPAQNGEQPGPLSIQGAAASATSVGEKHDELEY
ncbi:hypothetical protein ACM66B_000975 [Microbotryomycetes sp. NB124-2]